jgi:hypothetical protein
MPQTGWKETKLNPLRILLDIQNPRIEVANGASQEEIRLKLLAHERVVELARDIADYGSLLPGERIIVTKENNKYVVLEGNRRTCACQLLLKSELIPEKYRKSIRKSSKDLILALTEIKVDIAPSRDDAEPVITKRHTEQGIIKWNTTAKMRRASRLFATGYDIEQIAEKLSSSKGKVREDIRNHHLVRYIIDLDCWDHKENEILTDQVLKTNPYTRFFNIKGVKEKLGLSFDEQEWPQTILDKTLFNQYMRHIARSFLLPDRSNHNKPIANTRTTKEEIFDAFPVSDTTIVVNTSKQENQPPSSHRKDESSPPPKNSNSSTDRKSSSKANKPSAPKSATASVFFENLVCSVQDDRLIAITGEITRIDHKDMPVAAAMLLRGLFESALDFQIKVAKKTSALHQFIKDNNKGKLKDVGLEALMRFCANKNNDVFLIPRICDQLTNFRSTGLKDQLDFVVHGRWAEASPEVIERAAKCLRPIINHILAGQNEPVEEVADV